jgi:hypothetical protein
VRWRERVKIGTSSNPRQRLAVIPHDEVLAFERGGRLLEQRRHAEFAASRWAGSEWFRLDDPLVRHLAELAGDGADPWESYDRWRSEELARRA